MDETNQTDQPDIYPLGQGHGLVADLLNFGLNNLYRYGQRSGEFNNRVASTLQDIQAGNHPDLSPLVSDIVSTNPASAGVLGPIRTQAQKQVVRAMWRADPEVVKAIQTDPRVLNINIPGSGYSDPLQAAKMAYMWGEMPEGAAATYNATRGMRVGPATLRGAAFDPAKVIPPPAFSPWAQPIRTTDRLVTQKGGMTSLPEAAAHEGHHFLNEPRIYGEGGPTNEEALAMYDRLSPYLAKHAQKAALEGGKLNADPRVALDEALAYLSQGSARAPGTEGAGSLLHDLLKMKPGPEQGTTAGVRLTPNVIGSAVGKAEAMDKSSLGGMVQNLISRLTGGGGPGTRQVTFNKFSAGETKGSDVLNQIYNEMQRKEGKSGVWLSRGGDAGTPLSRDEFMKSILKDVAEAAMPSANFPEYTNVAQGLTQLRRNLGPGVGIRISPQETAAVLQHLDKNGMLERKVLEDSLSKFRDPRRELIDDRILARMKRFAEESGRGK